MTPTPLDKIRWGWQDHKSALWWLGLLYRRPAQFETAVKSLDRLASLKATFWLYLHILIYVLVLCIFGRWIVFGWFGVPIEKTLPTTDQLTYFHFTRIVAGITVGMAVTGISLVDTSKVITVGISYGIAIGIVVAGIAFGITNAMIAIGIAVVGIAVDIAGEIAGGIAVGIAVAIVFGSAFGIAFGNAFAIAFAIAFAVAFAIAFGITFEIIAVILAFGITGAIAFGTDFGILVGFTFGITFGIASAILLLRVHYHPLFWWLTWPKPLDHLYRFHPVAWDDLCRVPFLRLDRLLVAYAEYAPESGEREIERLIQNYPSQRHAALKAQTVLLARQAAHEKDLTKLEMLLAPLPEGKKGPLSQTPRLREMVSEIAGIQMRLNTVSRPVLREPIAQILCERIENFRHQIGGFHEPLASEFRLAATHWLEIAQKQVQEAQAILTKELSLVVFRAGDPVNREQEAFVPRYGVVGDLDKQAPAVPVWCSMAGGVWASQRFCII